MRSQFVHCGQPLPHPPGKSPFHIKGEFYRQLADVVAFVVPRPETRGQLTDAQLVEWCRAEMAVYKAPRRVVLVDALPRTASGKILRRALRERASSQ